MMKRIALVAAVMTLGALAEVQVIDGKKYECKDGLCYLVEDDQVMPFSGGETPPPQEAGGDRGTNVRIAQGYMRSEEFIAFIENREPSLWNGRLARSHGWLLFLFVLLGGLAMNLTPCVLPMIPINLIVIGKSATRGAAYGLGMAVAYGALGVAAAVGGLAFGDIQGSPWFNAAVSVVFVGLALALFGVWFLDLSKRRGAFAPRAERGLGFAFFMGAMSAVLAGACVAPVLVSVLLLTADLYAKGNALALGLPFVMGLGMALPWPFAGAGMKVLPKPGVWMKWVNRAFGVVVLGFAAWYGWLAWKGFSLVGAGETHHSNDRFAAASPVDNPPRSPQVSGLKLINATPSTLNSRLSTLNSESAKPILFDCWATWCKNCAAMDKVIEKPEVQEALKSFTVIKLQAEDISELRRLKGFESIRGLPAFVIFE